MPTWAEWLNEDLRLLWKYTVGSPHFLKGAEILKIGKGMGVDVFSLKKRVDL